MRLKNVPGSREAVSSSVFCVNDPDKYKGKWRSDFFKNDNKIYIEIGTGKGKFIIQNAITHPDIDFIGIEMYSSVLIRATEHLKEMENPPQNLCLLNFDATNIEDIFDKDEIDRIYLNFSDPWPKDRHAKRRLTSSRFLNRYINFLKENGEIHFKTDNDRLFDFSIDELKENGWDIKDMTRDLHKNSAMNEDNIMTEYEMRFINQGVSINKLIAVRPKHLPR